MDTLKRLWPYFRKYRLYLFLSVIASAIVSSTDAGVAYITKDILDGIFISKNERLLHLIPIVLIVMFIVRCSSSFFQSLFIQLSSQRAIQNIRDDMYHKIIKLPVAYFHDNTTGVLMTKVINDVSNIQAAVASVMRIMRSVFTVIALVGVVFYQSPRLGVSIFLIVPLMLIIIRKSGRKIKKTSHKSQLHLGELGDTLNESFSGIKVVKSFSNEDKEYKKFVINSANEIKYRLKQALISSISSPMIETLAGMSVAVIIFVGGLQVINGTTTTGTFFSFITAFGLMFEPIKKINNYNTVIQKARASAERIFEVMDSENTVLDNNGTIECDAHSKKIEFRNVSFRYNSSDTNVLDGLNLTIEPGMKAAIVGSSGAGKSTIAALLPRFYDVTEGGIYIGGTDIRDFNVYSLRRNIGIVSQEPFLFNNTIKYNIAYGVKDPDDHAILRAAEQSYSLGFIEELPDGIDTLIGERGCRISGGQRQRITIARALLMNPPVLVLDEATSALDTESEKIVQKALNNLMKNRTSIVIAHRLSTVADADMIVVLNKGKIEAAGTHTRLLEESGTYATLCKMQMLS